MQVPIMYMIQNSCKLYEDRKFVCFSVGDDELTLRVNRDESVRMGQEIQKQAI